MTPLQITARLAGAISLPRGSIALDALLASQVALRGQLPPPRSAEDCAPLEIPIAREPGGRFHLASFSVGEFDQAELRYVSKRAPAEQYQTIGAGKIRRVLLSAGANKSYRIPMPVSHARGDVLRWWCLGDADGIRDLLSTVVGLGKRRAVGYGRVLAWTVEPVESWGEGFPVVLHGCALRPLPQDWPGLELPKLRHAVLSYPYWAQSREEMLACP